MQQLKLELAGYESCCKRLGDDLAAKDREKECSAEFVLFGCSAGGPFMMHCTAYTVAARILLACPQARHELV